MNVQTPIETPLSHAAREFLAKPKQLLIGGAWVAGAADAWLPVEDPATGLAIDRVVAGRAEDVDRAVKAAGAAFEGWSRARPADRERLLWRLSDLIERDADLLAELESIDNGKPKAVARAFDVSATIDYFRYMAGWATKVYGRTASPSLRMSADAEYHVAAVLEPIGVVGQIIPWNFPLLMAAWKLAPALAVGCTSVLKPAEQTSLTALYLGELIVEAGFPAGVANIVTGLGHEAGAALVAHPGVEKIAFTGSTEVGKQIGAACMMNLKRVSLELGGKSPVILAEDADLDKAVTGAAQAIFFNSGQVCTAGSRLFVHSSRYDETIERLSAIAKELRIGPGWKPDTEIGPLVSEEQRERVLSYIDIGRVEGATVAVGGGAVSGQGYFVEPTVLADVNPDMRVSREEIFGPVLVAQRYHDIEEAAALANSTVYGLGASIWTRSLSTAHRLASRIKAGSVWVNGHNLIDPAVPFGGYRQSGIGREHGEEAVRLYTEVKSMWFSV